MFFDQRLDQRQRLLSRVETSRVMADRISIHAVVIFRMKRRFGFFHSGKSDFAGVCQIVHFAVQRNGICFQPFNQPQLFKTGLFEIIFQRRDLPHVVKTNQRSAFFQHAKSFPNDNIQSRETEIPSAEIHRHAKTVGIPARRRSRLKIRVARHFIGRIDQKQIY